MSNKQLLVKILRLKELKINGFEFRQRDKELPLHVKPYRTAAAILSAGGAARSFTTAPSRGAGRESL